MPISLAISLAFSSSLRVRVASGWTWVEAEVSGAIVFLLSPAAAFISGVTVQIDGAASLGSAVFPLSKTTKSVPFDGFHRAVTPDVLK